MVLMVLIVVALCVSPRYKLGLYAALIANNLFPKITLKLWKINLWWMQSQFCMRRDRESLDAIVDRKQIPNPEQH